MSQCEKCSRDLGPDILSCQDIGCGCPYEVIKIPLQKNSAVSQTLVWIGLSIIILTFVFASPDADTDTFTLMIQVALACILGILGLLAFILGYVSLTAEREIVRHRTIGDMWERISSNKHEIKARIFNSWKKILPPDNYQKLSLPPSQLGFIYYDAKYNLVELLSKEKCSNADYRKLVEAAQKVYSAIIYYLFFEGIWKINSVRVYTARGQSYFNSCDEKLYFLRARRDKEVAGLAEKSLYWSLLAAGSQFHNPFAISPRDLAFSVFGQSAKSAKLFLKLVYRDVLDAGIYDARKCTEEINMVLQDLPKLEQDIETFKKRHDRLDADFNHEIDRAFVEIKNKDWSKIFVFSGGGLNLKTVRIAIVGMALMGFTALQLYFPYRNAMKITAAVEDHVKDFNLEDLREQGLRGYIEKFKKFAGIKDTKVSEYQELFAADNEISKITALGFLKNTSDLMEIQEWQDKILSLLEDESEAVRSAAADLLGVKLLSPGVAVPKLTRMLEDPNYPSQLSAINALGSYGPQARMALPDLQKIVGGGGSTDLVQAAQNAISMIEGK